VFIYVKDGKRTEMGLGTVSTVTLEEARTEAAKLLKAHKANKNPLAEKQQQEHERKLQIAKSMTFKQCAEAFINAHKAEWKNPKHIQQWQNTLAQYALPVFGDLDVKTIDTALITKCLEPIWLTKNETAGREEGVSNRFWIGQLLANSDKVKTPQDGKDTLTHFWRNPQTTKY
jgi:hypothetical protein